MTSSTIRVLTAGAALLMTAALATGCGDDSTASAPTDAVSSRTSAPSSTSATSSEAAPSSSAATSTEASSDGQPDDTEGLPATGPAPADVPEGVEADNKTEAYLAELKKQGVSVPNDPDNAIALSAAQAVCNGKEQGTSTDDIKIFVVPLVGSGTTDEAKANADADKVIKAAESKYC
ncbi:DUF732 domain-containing protein [Williamsia sp. 1135]|uniref:DUF732 domain-containing protein n=1 Tax=Williamsia sp. 1135 TaxID=1889262 RepID=UPI000A117CB9|nr:DUF732 domain-containing protein [Williamsia sp. 1135]ORM34761.1 hypothetical protein BFL43_10905 [Williamsia sp. 1135]